MLNTIKPGDLVRLHPGVLPWANKREWRYLGRHGNCVLLEEKEMTYDWETDAENIDWNSFKQSEESVNHTSSHSEAP